MLLKYHEYFLPVKQRRELHQTIKLWILMIISYHKFLICGFAFFRVVMYGSYTIFVHLCEEKGKLPFSSASAMLVIECLKVRIWFVKQSDAVTSFSAKGSTAFILKAVLPLAERLAVAPWCMNNNGHRMFEGKDMVCETVWCCHKLFSQRQYGFHF